MLGYVAEKDDNFGRENKWVLRVMYIDR